MSVKVRIFYPDLKRLVDGSGEIVVDGRTVGECLHDLARRYPGAGGLMFDSHGGLQERVYVHVNMEGMRKADLAHPVGVGDELILAVLAAGG